VYFAAKIEHGLTRKKVDIEIWQASSLPQHVI